MANIDERVVSMKFDNRDFEKNVKTSMSTLDKLKNSLSFSNVGDGVKTSFNKIHNSIISFSNNVKKIFGETQKASSTVLDVTGIQNSLDVIQKQTSAFGEWWKGTFSNLVNHIIGEWNKAYNAVVKQPLTDGFKEYELKMGSVQTIMASTGASLEEVNGYLQELNTYADRTIYSFSDMTSSIGKFTNSGVKLEDAVKAIQGVSNVAAVSGANAQQASHAMYNFAQALSSGAVKLIDWKSIENANMATVEFKQNLIDTALEVGTVVKKGDEFVSTTTDMTGKMSDAFDSVHNFNNSLSSQWMTTEVLVKTLGKYTDETTELGKKAFAAAQDVKTWSQLLDTLKEALGSGWGQSFELIIGDFNEAKTLFTDINNILSRIVDKTSDFRNAFIKAWVDNGGRDKLIADINKILVGFEKITDFAMGATETGLKLLLGEDYKKIFGDFSSGIAKASETAEDAQKKLMQWQAAYDIWVKGTYGNGQQRKDAIEAIFKDEGASYEAIQNIIEGIIDGSVDIYSGLENVKKEAHDASIAQQSLAENTGDVTDAFSTSEPVINKLYDTFNSLRNSVSNVKDSVVNLFSAIRNIGTIIGKTFINFADYKGVAYDIENVTKIVKSLSDGIKKASERTSSLSVIFAKTFMAINKVYSFFRETMVAVKDNVSNVFGTLTKNQTVVTKIRSTISSASTIITNIARGISNLAIALINVSGVFVDSFLRVFNFDVVASDLSNLIGKFVDWTKKIRDGSEETESLSTKFDAFFEFLNKAYETLKTTILFVIDTITKIKNTIRDAINAIDEWSSNVDQHSKLYRAWNALSTILSNLIVLFSNIKTALINAFGPKVNERLKNTESIFSKILKTVKNIINGGLEKLVTGLEKLAKFDFSSVNLSWIDKLANFKITGVFEDAGKFDGIKTLLSNMGLDKSKFNIDNPFANLTDWIMGAFTPESLETVKMWGKKIGDAILHGLADLDWGAIWSFTSFIIFLLTGVEIIKMLKNINAVMLKASGFLVELQTQIKNIGTAIKNRILTDALNVSLTLIVALVLALIVFTELPQDKLVVAAAIMVVVLESIYRIINKLTEFGTSTSVSNSKLKKLVAIVNSFGDIFGAIGIIMIGIAALAAVMAYVDHPIAILTGIIIVVALVAAMAVTVVILLEKFGGVGANLDKLTRAMIEAFQAIGTMVLVLVGTAFIVQKFDIGFDDMAIAIEALVVTLLLFAGLCYATKYFPATGAVTVRRVAKSMLIIAGSIDLMIPAFIALALIGKFAGDETMTATIGSIFLIILAMGGLMFAMSKTASTMTSSTIKKTLALVIGMGIILAAVAAVLQTGALATIASMSATPEGAEKLIFILELVAAGILSVALAITLMAFAVSKVSGLGRSLAKMGIGLAGIGVAVLGVGAGLLAIVYAFTLLPNAADGLVIFAQKLEENGPVIAKTFATLVLVVIGAILGVLAAVKSSVALQIVAIVVYIAIILATFVHGHVGDIVAWIGQILLDVVALLGGIAGDIVYALISLLIVVVGWLGMAIIDKAPVLLDVLKEAIVGILETLLTWLGGEILKGVGDINTTIGEALKELGFDSIGNTLIIGGNAVWQMGYEGQKSGQELAGIHRQNIKEMLDDETEWMENASEEFKKKSKKFTSALSNGNMNLGEALNFGTNFDAVKAADGIGAMFSDPTKALYTNSAKFKGAAGDAATSVIAGYNTLEEAINKSTLSYEDWEAEFLKTESNQKSSFEMHNKYEAYKKDVAERVSAAYDAEKNDALGKQLQEATGNTKSEFITQLISGEADISVSDFIQMDASDINVGSMEDWNTLGLDSGAMFRDGFINGSGELNGDMSYNMADLYNEYGIGVTGNETDWEQLGIDTSDEIGEGVEANTEEFKEAARTLGDALMDEFHDITGNRAYEEGQNIADQVKQGVSNSLTKSEFVLKKKAESTGSAIAEGIKKGYKDKMTEIRNTAYATGNTMLKAFCSSMGIASPSKKMIEAAHYIMDGLMIGMRDKTRTLIDTTTKTANDIFSSFSNTNPVISPILDTSLIENEQERTTRVIDALKSPMDFLISYFNGELEYDPSIRPTMDISDIRYGTGMINNMLGRKSYEIGTEIDSTMEQLAFDRMDYMEAMKNGYNDGNVLGAIGKLNNDINNLNQSMSNMTVVMDTGALVGSIAEPVDYALGQRQYMRGRGM